MSVGVRRTTIRDLAHGSKDFLLVAVIISKQNPKTIRLKSGSGNIKSKVFLKKYNHPYCFNNYMVM